MTATTSNVRKMRELASTTSGADFVSWRATALKPIEAAAAGWNSAVADLVRQIGNELPTYAHRVAGDQWHSRVADTLDRMREPLHSDVILSTRAPKLSNSVIKGAARSFCATFLEEDIEFMPRPMAYPKFPYFTVEPATPDSLHEKGLVLFANPPANTDDEPDCSGTPISRNSYMARPMVSVELSLGDLGTKRNGAILLNWSFRGRAGARAKIFINGEQDVESFEVISTDDDAVPNFWTLLPWSPGTHIVDLKHVGAGYLWFEHVDVHHVTWFD